ncbi:MAG TPA: transglycosylase SLT domain-containing protein [Stellaceae bacterium]|nr:transglycosylase SLT domain-containing protein [Stellaceae bacterium]
MSVPNNPYPAAARAVDPAIVRSIRQASVSSSSDFGLLMAQAAQESSFRPDAKAATGSAAGLFQFIDSTWLDMMQRFGAKYGEGQLAAQITTNAAGKPEVSDPAARKEILALREDPSLSASLAGEYAKLNKDEVEHALGHSVGRADLYMAHFLGAGGATTFLKALETNGATPAASLLPDAAASNRGIFYDSETGRAKSVAEIYRSLGGRIDQEAGDFAPAVEAAEPAASTTAASATPTAGGFARRLDFAGLGLTAPVAAMLDTLTQAALRLMTLNATEPPKPPQPQQHRTTAGESSA